VVVPGGCGPGRFPDVVDTLLGRHLRQAVARPSEVDDWRQSMANAEASTCRSAAVSPAAVQLAIGEHHIYDI